MLGLKRGKAGKIRRLTGVCPGNSDVYEWDGRVLHYPNRAGVVDIRTLLAEEWEVVKEPTVEEYVRERGFRLYSPNIIDVDHAGYEPFVRVSPKKPFTLETAKIACDALEALK